MTSARSRTPRAAGNKATAAKKPASTAAAQRPSSKPSREEKKAQTRTRLLEAAAAVFARRGLADASLDDIAVEAGLTKGAVYSNFGSKEELIREVLDSRLGEPSRAIPRLVDAHGTQDQQSAQAGQLFMGLLGNERDAYLLELEFMLYLARHPEANDPARFRQNHEVIARVIEQRAQENGTVLPLPAADLTTALFALGSGLALERLVNPTTVPDDLFGRVLAVLFRPTT